MATQNSINHISNPLASSAVTIDPGAAGDSYVQFNINTANEFRIGVDDTDDSFRISQGNALGTNDRFVMTAAGERLMPLQPAFLAYQSANTGVVTGNGTEYSVIFNTEVFDLGTNYNNGTGVFTAPVDGRYLLDVMLYPGSIGVWDTTHTYGLMRIRTSNRTYIVHRSRPSSWFFDASARIKLIYTNSTIADMDAADTAYFTLEVGGGTFTIRSGGSNAFASGHLMV